MLNIITLLKLEVRNTFGRFRLNDKKNFLKVLVSLIFGMLMYFLILFGARLFFAMFDKANMNYEALVFFFTGITLALIISGMSSITKVLYFKGDNEMLMRFPVKGSEVFISKTLFLLMSRIVMTSIIIIPFLVAYAETIKVPASFYFALPMVIIFLVFIPFFISNLLAIPFMHISNKIRHKFGLIIISTAVLITLMFILYMVVFEKMVEYFKDSNFSVFDPAVVEKIKKVTAYFIPFKYFADLLMGQNLVVSYIVLTSIFVLSLLGTILVIVKLYHKTLLNNVEIEGSAYTHKTKNKVRGILSTLFRKEFIQIFRSVNYSFQYFVLACAMPFMVYYCNEIAIKIGKNDIGEQIIPGLTLLVMLIFTTVINSFSATSVTREGANFYHTKVLPVSIRTQLAVKFLMYLLVSFVANIITTIIIIASKQMEVRQAFILFGFVQFSSIALTLVSMKFDVKKPRFNLSGEGELVNNNSNTTSSVGLGFFVAITQGAVGMFLAYVFGLGLMNIFCLAFTALFFLIGFIKYNYKLKKTYDKIA